MRKILVLALSVWVLVNSGLYAETIEENIFLRKAHETQKEALRELYFGSHEKAKKILTRIVPQMFLPLKSLEVSEKDCKFYVRVNGVIQNPEDWTFRVLKLIDEDLTSEMTTEFVKLSLEIDDSVKYRRSKNMCR